MVGFSWVDQFGVGHATKKEAFREVGSCRHLFSTFAVAYQHSRLLQVQTGTSPRALVPPTTIELKKSSTVFQFRVCSYCLTAVMRDDENGATPRVAVPSAQDLLDRCNELLKELDQFRDYLRTRSKQNTAEVRHFRNTVLSELKSLEKVRLSCSVRCWTSVLYSSIHLVAFIF